MPERTPTPEQVLACPMDPNDSGAATVGGYLARLVGQLWQLGEGFSGKRPFGNSGWEYDVYTALAKARLIEGLDYDEEEEEIAGSFGPVVEARADEAVRLAIEAMGVPRPRWDFGRRGEDTDHDQEEMNLRSAVFQALGAASACWDNLTGAGVFESDRACAIGERLLEFIEQDRRRRG